ncbi:MAG TPA: DUF2934 domain-containing protein [Candidatus Omnitrophota bacterium]|nr:DUF2934 domain-containing protein [Candidatus Omnitrophota bacterium]
MPRKAKMSPRKDLSEKISPEKMRDLVKTRAEELYQRRGCQPGKEWSDWFEAEKQIREEYSMGEVNEI